MNNVSYKHIWSVTYPILISLLMEQMIGITDTMFLGRYGEVELGASAIAGVYYLAMFVVAFGFGIGAQIIMGRRNGEGRYRQIGPVMVQGAFFMVVMAALMFTVSRIWTPGILRSIIESDAIYHASLEYLNWRIYGFFFAFIAIMFRSFYVGITRTSVLTSNSLIMVGANVLLNYTLIFGHFGFPRLGIAGAAIASSISELVSLIFFFIYTWKKTDLEKYGFTYAFRFRPRLLKGILAISSWMMVQNFVSMSMWFIFFLSIEHLGERPLALVNITRTAATVFYMIVSSFASTTSTLVSNSIGAGRSNDIFPICTKCIKMASLFILPLIAFCLLFPGLVSGFFTNNLELAQESIPVIRVMAATIIFVVPAFILFSAVSGTGNTRTAFFMELICLSIYLLAIYVIVIKLRSDVAICWLTDPIYSFALIPMAWIYLRRGNWQSKKI